MKFVNIQSGSPAKARLNDTYRPLAKRTNPGGRNHRLKTSGRHRSYISSIRVTWRELPSTAIQDISSRAKLTASNSSPQAKDFLWIDDCEYLLFPACQ